MSSLGNVGSVHCTPPFTLSRPWTSFKLKIPLWAAISMATAATGNHRRCCRQGEKVAVGPHSHYESSVWVCSVPSCHWYHCVSGVYLCAAECFSLVQEKQPCCLLIGWMTGGECDGRSTINFPVVGKGHEVTALWFAIKRTRQIGWGALVRGRARRAGSDKGGDGDAAPHNSELDKSLRHPSDTTATPAHTRTHTDMHINIRWQHKSASPELLLLLPWKTNIHIYRYADDTHVYLNPWYTQRWSHSLLRFVLRIHPSKTKRFVFKNPFISSFIEWNTTCH